MSESPPTRTRGRLGSASLLVALLALGCEGEVGGPPASSMAGTGAAAAAGNGTGGSGAGKSGTGGTTPTGAGGTTPTSGAGGSGTTAGTGGGSSACSGSRLTTPKRVVRLSEYQLFNSYVSLFGATAASTITANEDPPSLREREFPPISGEIEVSEGLFALYDRLAQAAMKYVAANSGSLTSCGAAPSDTACVQDYLLSFAEKAFRHPLSAEEQSAITGQFWSEMTGAGATVAQALAYGVYGVLSSPSFIYRTEFGSDVAADGALTPHEFATTLALFLTDSPPDDELLAAAAANQLGTAEEVRAHATRILEKPEARANLEIALIKYFRLTNAPTVILNPEATPGITVTGGMQASIYHEGELFMKNLLWSGPMGNLLTSRQTWTSSQIATQVYGVTAPAQTDADGFGLVELGADRAGLLTLSTFLLSGARSTGTSPVTRGLAVNASIVCAVNPPFPEVLNPDTGELEPDPQVTAAIEALADKSELEKTEYRAMTPKCGGCHSFFDAFGMVLEPYDALGRFRTMDLEGRPIDATWTTTWLPETVGGAMVTNAAETAQALVASGALDRCMAMNFINYALTEISKGGASLDSTSPNGDCAVQGVIDNFMATDRSFSSLVREIAASETLGIRSKGL
jgi:hypothetical protein